MVEKGDGSANCSKNPTRKKGLRAPNIRDSNDLHINAREQPALTGGLGGFGVKIADRERGN
jgi:hypothetical protein